MPNPNVPYSTSSGSIMFALVNAADNKTPWSGSTGLPTGLQIYILKYNTQFVYVPSGSVSYMGNYWCQQNLNQYDSNTMGPICLSAQASGSTYTSNISLVETNVVNNAENDWVSPSWIYTQSLSGSIQAENQFQAQLVSNTWGSANASGAIYWGSLSGSVQGLKQYPAPTLSQVSGSAANAISQYGATSSGSIATQVWTQMPSSISGSIANETYREANTYQLSVSGSNQAIKEQTTLLIADAYSGSWFNNLTSWVINYDAVSTAPSFSGAVRNANSTISGSVWNYTGGRNIDLLSSGAIHNIAFANDVQLAAYLASGSITLPAFTQASLIGIASSGAQAVWGYSPIPTITVNVNYDAMWNASSASGSMLYSSISGSNIALQQSAKLLSQMAYSGSLMAGTAPTTTQIVNAIMGYVIDGSLTLAQCIKYLQAVEVGNSVITGNTIQFYDPTDGSVRVTAVTDGAGQRTSVVLT